MKYFPQTPSSPGEAPGEDGGGGQVDVEDSPRPGLPDRRGDDQSDPAHHGPDRPVCCEMSPHHPAAVPGQDQPRLPPQHEWEVQMIQFL